MKQPSSHLFDGDGQRKYCDWSEYVRLRAVAQHLPLHKSLFVQLVAVSGCRISEALEVSLSRVGTGYVVLRTLKRRTTVYRLVHLPAPLAAQLRALARGGMPDQRLWSVNRSTAYRWVKRAMRLADVHGRQACPRGLRHGFGARNVIAGTQLNFIQKWMGHASPRSTVIYMDVSGPEERQLASRTW
ncbi:site-specific integrase [Ancylobacter sp. 6x-1]|uniref:Site-specific integrase n=1 Tax=Ancylobacter crimeensis TaxID=2579147 RepID=A0ABT0DBN1_9HYPH|nr:tyrosine-type recombinase/integrase [Ancylobacter crimeensis]MCK0197373.1 site-specific integrase [Ancylobacter crimeensis]